MTAAMEISQRSSISSPATIAEIARGLAVSRGQQPLSVDSRCLSLYSPSSLVLLPSPRLPPRRLRNRGAASAKTAHRFIQGWTITASRGAATNSSGLAAGNRSGGCYEWRRKGRQPNESTGRSVEVKRGTEPDKISRRGKAARISICAENDRLNLSGVVKQDRPQEPADGEHLKYSEDDFLWRTTAICFKGSWAQSTRDSRRVSVRCSLAKSLDRERVRELISSPHDRSFGHPDPKTVACRTDIFVSRSVGCGSTILRTTARSLARTARTGTAEY